MAETLTGREGGLWNVTTLGSTHLFDLDAMTVTRVPGESAHHTANDRARPLLEIVHCTVGARGYWLMSPDPDEMDFLEHYWHISSTIQSIDQEPSD